jgi:hypothetical protein
MFLQFKDYYNIHENIQFYKHSHFIIGNLQKIIIKIEIFLNYSSCVLKTIFLIVNPPNKYSRELEYLDIL